MALKMIVAFSGILLVSESFNGNKIAPIFLPAMKRLLRSLKGEIIWEEHLLLRKNL